MLRITDSTPKTLQGITITVGTTLTLTEDASGFPHLDVTPAASGTIFDSALKIRATTPGGHRQLHLIDKATETKNNWLIGTQPAGDDVEITPSTTVGGLTFSNPIITFKLGGNVGINTGSPGATAPPTWAANAGNRLLEIVSAGAFDAGVYIRHSSGTGVGFDLWSDQSAGDTYIDNRSTSGSVRIRTQTSSTQVDAVTILAGGQVGIGNTSPGEYLVVQKNQNATTRVQITNTDTTNGSSRASFKATVGAVIGELVAIIGSGVFIGSVSSDTLSLMVGGAQKVAVDTSGNTTVVLGGAANTGKFTANRVILPVGADLWAT